MKKRFQILAALFVGLVLPASAGPLKIYLLVGQSNMQGHAAERTLDHLGMDPKTAPMLKAIRNADGTAKLQKNVWISSIEPSLESGEKHGRLTVGYGAGGREPKIGPELTFGITMQNHVGEPILLIKTSWGGKSLNTDFRPPSAGPYKFNEQQLENFKKRGKNVAEVRKEKTERTGVYYRLMLEHTQKVVAGIPRVYPDYDAKAGYELAGFVWFQGWNDMVDGSTYPTRGQHFVDVLQHQTVVNSRALGLFLARLGHVLAALFKILQLLLVEFIRPGARRTKICVQ